VEDDDLNMNPDGHCLNGDTAANSITPLSTALPLGALLPGNFVTIDTSSTNTAQPNVKRPTNVPSANALADATTAPTVADSTVADGTFANAAYTFLYVWKNANGQITKQSATAAVTPTNTHSVNVTVPANAVAVSADVYCSIGAGGAGEDLALLGNILAASFNVATKFTTPPTTASNQLPANVNTTVSANSALSNAIAGLVFGAPYYRYMPTDNAIYTGQPITVIRGQFTAVLDINGFAAGLSPTTIGQKIYYDSSGLAANLGLLSITKNGTANVPDMAIGTVIGFEQFTAPGGSMGPVGVQQSSTYASPNGTQVAVGGVTVARVQFSIPYVPLA
jgi:hypothetical protein